MPEVHKKVGDTWQEITEIGYTDGVTLRALDEVWYNDNGSWRKVFDLTASASVILSATTVSASRNTVSGTGTATAGVSFENDGTVDTIFNSSSSSDSTTTVQTTNNNWYSTGPITSIGDDYEIYVSSTGSNVLGVLTGTLDTWLALTSDRVFSLAMTGNNIERDAARTLEVKIRDTATLTETGPAIFQLNALIFGP